MVKRFTSIAAGAIAAAGVVSSMGVGSATAAEADIFSVTVTAEDTTIMLTPPSLNACNAMAVTSGTVAPPAGELVWTGTDQLLSHSPALADTMRFRGVAQAFPHYFAPRTIALDLKPGTYTIAGQCTPYDDQGNYAGDDTIHTKTFTVKATGPGPEDPGEDDGAWGSLGDLLPG
ncbi:hypothetical protein ACWFOS_01485 [Gordonia terrae]